MGAHYREGTRSRSDAEFVSKLQVGLQELEETLYWMELLVGSGALDTERLGDLMQETDELTAILTTCVKNVKDRK